MVDGVALDAKNGTARWTASPKAPAESVDGKLHGAVLSRGVFASPKIPYADGHAVVYTWIAATTTTASGAPDATSLTNVVEIRDSRTGEVLHQGLAGGAWTLGNYFTGPDGLYPRGHRFAHRTGPAARTRSIYTLPRWTGGSSPAPADAGCSSAAPRAGAYLGTRPC